MQAEGGRSITQQVTTAADTSIPAVPTGFTVTSPNDITNSSVILKWNQNSETDFDHYNIYYGTTSAYQSPSPTKALNSNSAGFTITGLTSSTRYYFAITAVDTAGNESAKSEELIVDILPDTLPPLIPDGFTAELSGQNEITVSMSDINSQMADFAGNIIFYGTTSGGINSIG